MPSRRPWMLLVDEAYYLFNAGNDRMGQESIEILLNVMENQQDRSVVALPDTKTAWTLSSPTFLVRMSRVYWCNHY
jgi:hypothetical protein